jgi:hypothetical protein
LIALVLELGDLRIPDRCEDREQGGQDGDDYRGDDQDDASEAPKKRGAGAGPCRQ